MKYVSLGRNWTRDHISNFQENSLERECLAWASYAEKQKFHNESNSSYYLRATMYALDNKLDEIQFTYTMNDLLYHKISIY